MYKCRCGAVFADYDLRSDEKCPECGGFAYDSAEVCEVCKRAYFEDKFEVYGGFCKTCAREAYCEALGGKYIGQLNEKYRKDYAQSGMSKEEFCLDDLCDWIDFLNDNFEKVINER